MPPTAAAVRRVAAPLQGANNPPPLAQIVKTEYGVGGAGWREGGYGDIRLRQDESFVEPRGGLAVCKNAVDAGSIQ